MGWFKKYFSVKKDSESVPEVKVTYLPDPAGNLEASRSKKQEEKREEQKKQEKAADNLKLVVMGAKVQCPMCTCPIGTLMVNFPMPSIQNKPIATEQDNTKMSLVFTGTCTKSPNAAAPCVAVMQLGQWQDTGTIKVQNKAPLLLKSTIKCLFGGVDIKIIHCGQMPMPPALSMPGAPVPAVPVTKTPAPSRIATDEEAEEISSLKEKLLNSDSDTDLRPSTNIAIVKGIIDGKEMNGFANSSKVTAEGSIPHKPFKQQILKTAPTASDIRRNKTHEALRAYDSEAKIMEHILDLTTEESTGEITVISENEFCDSCENILDVQMKSLRPELTIHKVYVHPYKNK